MLNTTKICKICNIEKDIKKFSRCGWTTEKPNRKRTDYRLNKCTMCNRAQRRNAQRNRLQRKKQEKDNIIIPTLPSDRLLSNDGRIVLIFD